MGKKVKADPRATRDAALVMSSRLLAAEREAVALRRDNARLTRQLATVTAALQTVQVTTQAEAVALLRANHQRYADTAGASDCGCADHLVAQFGLAVQPVQGA